MANGCLSDSSMLLALFRDASTVTISSEPVALFSVYLPKPQAHTCCTELSLKKLPTNAFLQRAYVKGLCQNSKQSQVKEMTRLLQLIFLALVDSINLVWYESNF